MGRDEEMNRLKHELMPALTNKVRRKVLVLHGLGGIGKTQLSVEFARKYHTSYSAVFWIDGSTKEKLRRSIADLAGRLPPDQLSERAKGYSQEKSSNVNEVVDEVLMWLCQPSNNQWLLIFDNVDREFGVSSGDAEAFDVKAYFPEADHGSILVTSRLASLWRLGPDIKLEPVNDVQGESIFTNCFGKSIEGKRTSNAGWFRCDLISGIQQVCQSWSSCCKVFRWRSIKPARICEKQAQTWRSI